MAAKKNHPTVPRHEPEVQWAIARRDEFDRIDLVPDTSLRRLIYGGVDLRSVGRRADEYLLMMVGVDAMHLHEREHTDMILCADDGNRYFLEFDGYLSSQEMKAALSRFENVVVEMRKGHDGIDAVVDGLVYMGLAGEWRV